MSARDVDSRVLDFLSRQQRMLAAYAPGLAGGLTAQPQRLRQQPELLAPTPRGRGHAIRVAAVDAHPDERANADVHCEGVDDQVQITAALADVYDNGGVVLLSSGTFELSDYIDALSYTTLRGSGRDVTVLRATACDAVRVTDVADISGIQFENTDKTDGTTRGIVAESPDDVLWLSGLITSCDFFWFGVNVQLYDGKWLLDDLMFWDYNTTGYTPWAIRSENHPSSGVPNNGEHAITRCIIHSGHGIYFAGSNGGVCRVFENEISVTTSDTALQLDVDDSLVALNDFTAGDVVIGGSDNRCALNRGGSTWTVNGDRNALHDNDSGGAAVTIAATADLTRHWGNDWSSVTDNGTNTKKNLDGSANDWNW